jgi:fibronectin-binding autotransporter adhesin
MPGKNCVKTNLIPIAVAGFLAFSLGAGSLRAANVTWSGGGGADNDWSDGSNWVGGTAPGSTSVTTSTDVATFDTVTANNTVTIDSTTQNIFQIDFSGNGTTSSAGSFTIGSTSGNPLLMSNGGLITIGAVGSGVALSDSSPEVTETIDAPLEIVNTNSSGGLNIYNSALSGTGADSAILDIAGSIGGVTTSTTVTDTLELRGTNTNANTISGLISNGGINTTLSIDKNDAGTWNLTNNGNSYKGIVEIFTGTLGASSINASQGSGTSALGEGGPGTTNINSVAVSNNTILLGQSGVTTATLDYTGSTASSNRPFLLNDGTSAGGGIIEVATSGQTLTLSGAITSAVSADTAALGLQGPGNGILSGGISNASGLAVTVSSGNWTYSNANSNTFTYGGTTSITGSGTKLAVNANLTTGGVGVGGTGVNAGSTLMGTGNITGAVTVTGATLQAGADNVTTGTTLTLNSGVSMGANSTLAFVLGSGNTNTTLALNSGSTNTFNTNQAVSLLGSGYTTGIYDNLITGLASDPGNESTWVITTAGDVGTFTFSGGDIDLDLTAVAVVPEPSTWVMLIVGNGLLLVMTRRLKHGLGMIG